MPNRFEQVDQLQDDVITLSLSRDTSRAKGVVICPATLMGGADDRISPMLDDAEACRSAVRLANEIKVPIVVCDPEEIWQSTWGDLFRAEG